MKAKKSQNQLEKERIIKVTGYISVVSFARQFSRFIEFLFATAMDG